ncbi:MAG TPA: methylated-DNA--[protein]-cysteine S-methyltransferase [Thermoflexia bacterium]|nr:methylated-DNA--[protein]-cysteine S-methyltransferase [Thermoflexia bacterium]
MKADITYARMDSPVGPLWVATTEMGICAVGLGIGQPEAFFAWLARHIAPEPPREDAETLALALAQLREYFSRIRRAFDLPLDVRGTAFQKAVWAEVARIPYGTTTTYSKIAQRIGRPGAARAVGAAVGANPLPILIPCHRVIGVGGSLTGYGGGLEVKAALLRLEGTLQRTPLHRGLGDAERHEIDFRA